MTLEIWLRDGITHIENCVMYSDEENKQNINPIVIPYDELMFGGAKNLVLITSGDTEFLALENHDYFISLSEVDPQVEQIIFHNAGTEMLWIEGQKKYGGSAFGKRVVLAGETKIITASDMQNMRRFV